MATYACTHGVSYACWVVVLMLAFACMLLLGRSIHASIDIWNACMRRLVCHHMSIYMHAILISSKINHQPVNQLTSAVAFRIEEMIMLLLVFQLKVAACSTSCMDDGAGQQFDLDWTNTYYKILRIIGLQESVVVHACNARSMMLP